MTAPAEVDRLFGGGAIGRTDALVAVAGGEVVVERYGDTAGPDTLLRSWSMAKSVLHAAVGLLVADGRLDLDAAAGVAAWAGDERSAITLRNLLEMRSGLAWREEPDDAGLPDVIDLLFGVDRRPQPDTAAWAADWPLATAPGTRTHYSSANSTIVAGLVRDLVGGPDELRAWLDARLFGPVGMTSPRLRFDDSGTWLASSYCSCTAADFARFGGLYLNHGRVGTTQVLDPAWVATAAVATGTDHQGRTHTMHWWRFDDERVDGYFASGYQGQVVLVVPDADVVVVRTGETRTDDRGVLTPALGDLVEALR